MQQTHKLRTALRWLLATVAATFVAAFPTRLSDHDLAVGLPLTWHSRREIVTLGEQSDTLSYWLLLLDIALVLAFFNMLRILASEFIHWRASQQARQS
jgi:hypothetical protein